MAAPFLGCVGLAFSDVSTDPFPPLRSPLEELSSASPPSPSASGPWADLPPELRILIVTRLLQSPATPLPPTDAAASSPAVQAAESLQRLRDFVACAGVNRTWRESCLEHFKSISPELQSRALIFPHSLSARGPESGPRVRCLFKKVKNVTELYLQAPGTELESAGRHLMSAKKHWRPWGTTYTISTDPAEFSRKGGSALGKIAGKRMAGFRSSSGMEDEFKIEAAERGPDGETTFHKVAAVIYSLNPHREAVKRRVMEVVLQPASPSCSSSSSSFSSSSSSSSSSFAPSSSEPAPPCPEALEPESDLVFRSKAPRWSAVRKTWWLNFGGRVTVPSVRNFQLIGVSSAPALEPAGFMDPDFEDPLVLLQSGKVGKGLYTLDYKAPFSALTAFAIVLSNMETSHGMDR